MARKTKQIEGQLDFFDMLMADLPLSEMDQFLECELCWCKTCKHNSKNEGEPRDFGGELKPCPACEFCIENDEPEVCEIGSYKNGCKLRAEEEGLGPNT
ncbi:MAG: hypothetical protein MJZ11_07415 [Lachnospiraceae bacterium]|nr:hypothetical protein [Lachnospiraceae bacterium]